jgi:pimeloyl-ACP methyl ester carboxylesterase
MGLPEMCLLGIVMAVGRVVAIDRPGHGASHGLTGAAARLGRQAEVVLDLVNALRAPVFLIGHSLGAILTLQHAPWPQTIRRGFHHCPS